MIYLSTHGFDRAVLLIPTWLLLVVWTLAAGLAVTGVVTNDIIGPALLGGLVLIVMLIGFTVMQHAFAGGITHGIVSDVERRALALTGAGDMIWDWDVSADKVFTSPETEQLLGLKRGALEGPAAKWLDVLHPLDRDRFRASLDSVVEQRRGRLTQDFRLRAADGHYLWFTLKARPVVGSDGEVVRLVGTLTDVTDFKNAEERLLFDAVHDNLTGLPNRELFIDRMEAAFAFARSDPQIRPSVIVIDLDRFKQVNDSVGIAVGDSILLTIARRLGRLLKPQDTLARLSGDQFALILLSEREPARIVAFAETMRRTLRAPIAFNDREIFITASIGLALAENQPHRTEEVLKDAELAMYYAKRIGGDRIEIFKPAMRSRKTDRLTMESELRRAIEREEIKVLYQPIVRLEDRAIAGFEALARWDHPKMGRLSPAEFISIAEEIGLIVDLGLFVLDHTARQLAIWQAASRAREPIFASVNVSSRQLLRHDLIQDLRGVLARTTLARGTLKLEITESLVMENPEARRPDAHPHPRARRRPVARRFRHRPFLARLSAALPVRHHQDRPVVRAHHRARHAAGDPALDHRDGARSRHGSGGGRRRNRFRRGRALPARLRIRAGLCLRRADDRGGRRRPAGREAGARATARSKRLRRNNPPFGLRVPGLARQLAEVDADLAQRLFVFGVGVGAENQFRIGRAMQPAVLLDFLFQLAGRPAGIAEREDGACRPVAARDRLEDIERGGEADALVDRQRRILDEEIGRVQHEAAPGFDRTALEHLDGLRPRRQFDALGSRDHLELHQQIGEIDIGRRLIDDDAHGAFGRMGADVDQAARKTLIAHRRHRDQHLAVEIAARGAFDSRFSSVTHGERLPDRPRFENESRGERFNPAADELDTEIVAKPSVASFASTRCSQ